jgi:hypothetical protein
MEMYPVGESLSGRIGLRLRNGYGEVEATVWIWADKEWGEDTV